MLFSAFMIFFVSIVFGIIVLDTVLKDKPTPIIYVNCHNLITWVGIGVLSTAIYYGHHNSVILTSLILFILSAVEGLVLFIIYIFKKRLPKWLVIIQTLTGVIALVLLLYYTAYQKQDNTSIYAEQIDVTQNVTS